MKKSLLICSCLLLLGFALGLWYGKQKVTAPPVTTNTQSAPEYLSLSDYDTIIKPKTSYYAYESQQKEAPPELKEFLVKQAYASFLEKDSCIKDGGACSQDNSDMKAVEADLDGDGTNEFIVLPWKVCECMMRGSSANGDIFIVKSGTDRFEVIGKLQGNGFLVSTHKTNGHSDIITNNHSSAASGTETIYKFQSITYGSYEKYLSKEYDFRRLH